MAKKITITEAGKDRQISFGKKVIILSENISLADAEKISAQFPQYVTVSEIPIAEVAAPEVKDLVPPFKPLTDDTSVSSAVSTAATSKNAIVANAGTGQSK